MIKLNLSSAETGPFALEAIFPVYSPRTRLSLLKQRSTPPVVNCPNLFKRTLEINSLCSIETTTRDYVEFFLYFCQSLAGFGTCKFLLTQYQSNTFLATWPYFGLYWIWSSVVGSWGQGGTISEDEDVDDDGFLTWVREVEPVEIWTHQTKKGK